jgi:predicted component of type VI protein secretion system
MRWSRPDIFNAVRDLCRHAQKCSVAHIIAMYRVMRCCVDTKELGWTLDPARKWDGKNKSFDFEISG